MNKRRFLRQQNKQEYLQNFENNLLNQRKIDLIKMMKVDPFCPTGFSYIVDKENPVGITSFNKIIPKNLNPFNQKTIYHFTKNGKEIIESGIFRFYWQMRNSGSDEVLSKYWFVETNKNANGSYSWDTHGPNWGTFNLAQITRTACFFTGKPTSRDAGKMRRHFGNDVLVVDYHALKRDVEVFCANNHKRLYIRKTKYVEATPKEIYPLPILGKTVGEIGLEASAIIDGLMQDGTCFNKIIKHKFEREVRFIFFDEYATLDENNEYIKVPISNGTMRLL